MFESVQKHSSGLAEMGSNKHKNKNLRDKGLHDWIKETGDEVLIRIAENLILGARTEEEAVLMMIIDDGNKNRERRKSIFSNEYKQAACWFGEHKNQDTLCYVTLVRGYRAQGEKDPLADMTETILFDNKLEQKI